MFTVIELQTTNQGTTSALVNTYDELQEAESKFHDILKYAAVSSLPIHSAAILAPEGYTIKNDSYTHIQPEQEAQNGTDE